MLMNEPKVTIVILNWNNASDTIECLDSISGLIYTNYSILIVDNGSQDNSVSRIREKYPEIDLLDLPKNIGYAEGNNLGIKQGLLDGCDYVLVLNNDTLVAPDMLNWLVELAESRPEIGMVGPMMYCTEPANSLFAAGSFIDWERGDLRHRGLFQPRTNFPSLNDCEPVDFIVGCCVLVKRNVIERIGVLDPIYFLNFEDVEWGLRAWRNGYEVWFSPKAEMWHKVSATLGRASPANTYYMTRNSLFFFRRNSPLSSRYQAIFRILFRTLRTVAAWSIKPEYRSKLFKQKKWANIFAIRDFLLGRFGKMGSDIERICSG
jgi:GT2 family glycosyltransferase